jgi:hypothetical protein
MEVKNYWLKRELIGSFTSQLRKYIDRMHYASESEYCRNNRDIHDRICNAILDMEEALHRFETTTNQMVNQHYYLLIVVIIPRLEAINQMEVQKKIQMEVD